MVQPVRTVVGWRDGSDHAESINLLHMEVSHDAAKKRVRQRFGKSRPFRGTGAFVSSARNGFDTILAEL